MKNMRGIAAGLVLTFAGPGLAVAGVSDRPLAKCVLESPLADIGTGFDAPGGTPIPTTNPLADAGGACAQNNEFRFGSGIHDMTGPAGDSITAGYENPEHIVRGIHTRQFARAFAIESPCNGRRVAMVVTDSAFITQGTRQTVLDLVTDDPDLSSHYSADNIMLSATHTHGAPGGEAHHSAFNTFRLGYDALVHEVYTYGIYQAIRRAHFNLQANADTAPIGVALAELLDTNINRSRPAYANNPQDERAPWTNSAGGEVDVNKLAAQLRFERADGTAVGIFNWFGVHTVSMGVHVPMISSDNKGLAAIGFEQIMGTDYSARDGAGTFVAAFAQADEGDSSPNLCFEENPYPSIQIGCGEDTVQSNAASAVKQLSSAIRLYDNATETLRGPVDYRLVHVPMNEIVVTDPVILDSLSHPTELDSDPKRTCAAALGYSMGAGAEDNPGPSQEGLACPRPLPVDTVPSDIQLALDTMAAYSEGRGYPVIPASTGSAIGCVIGSAPGDPRGGGDFDYSCQGEKPILFPIGTGDGASNPDLPLHLVRLGNLVIAGLPYEVTTMAARRLRATLLAELAPVGVDYVVVAGLTNDYVQYLTTREEYATQQYEGASTQFGPWTLAATQQEIRALAISLATGEAAPAGVPAPVTEPAQPHAAPYVAGDIPDENGNFGAVLADAAASYALGETVTARFLGAHPRNDTKARLGDSYAFVERKDDTGGWQVVATDRHPGVWFRWISQPAGPVPARSMPARRSENEVVWHIPQNAEPGTYRLRHSGTAVYPIVGVATGPQAYDGISAEFEVTGIPADCPGYPNFF